MANADCKLLRTRWMSGLSRTGYYAKHLARAESMTAVGFLLPLGLWAFWLIAQTGWSERFVLTFAAAPATPPASVTIPVAYSGGTVAVACTRLTPAEPVRYTCFYRGPKAAVEAVGEHSYGFALFDRAAGWRQREVKTLRLQQDLSLSRLIRPSPIVALAQVLLLATALRWLRRGQSRELMRWRAWPLIPMAVVAVLLAIGMALNALGLGEPGFGRALHDSLATEGKWPLIVAAVALAPLTEELAFRGVLWEGLRRAFPLWFVVALTTLEFTLLHAGQYGWGGLASVTAAGLALAWVRWRSGLVSLAVLTHMLINAVSLALATV